jgi:hypothetical protein
MALAILELGNYDEANLELRIDTGTNPYYQIKAGTKVRRDVGIDLVENVYVTTPMARNAAGGDVLNSSTDMSVPSRRFNRPNTYIQLFSYKTPDRKSPAVSRAVRVPVVLDLPVRSPSDYAASFAEPMSDGTTHMNATQYRTPRRIPCRTATLVRQASIDQLLGQVLKLAAPVVLDGLKATGGPGPNGGTTPAGGIIAQLIQMLLGSAAGGGPLSAPHSRSIHQVGENRFSRPFIFGIDDALIGAAIGQLVQVLPQIMNAANQKRVDIRKADNQLMAGMVSDINKRLMLDKLAELQKQPQAAGSPAPEQIQQLMALLQQAPAAPAQAGVPTPTAAPQSTYAYSFSNRATLTFEMGDAQEWNGGKYPLFAKGRNVVLKVRLIVGDPVPKTPLPKAILKVVWKDAADPSAHFEKIFKRKDVLPGALFECPFEAGELAHLPVGKPLTVGAELRWLTGKPSREIRALGSAEAVLINQFYLKDAGKETGDEIELRDMKLYRSFWNKVWEAPVLDGAQGPKKYNWELDANCRYSVLLSASHDSNGFMEPKLLMAKSDPESLSQKAQGRMKAGLELSVAELNKLNPLWGSEPVDAARLESFAGAGFLDGHATEFVHHLQLKGKAGQRGMVWVIPIFKMFGFKLAHASQVDGATGQVTAVSEEATHLPLPVAARVIGLKAKNY